MRILLDECVPRALRRSLPGHIVRTIREVGWSGKRNGELLGLMLASNYEVLLTVDQNLRYQQNLAASGVAVLIILADSNRIEDLTPFVPDVEAALVGIQPGDVVEVGS